MPLKHLDLSDNSPTLSIFLFFITPVGLQVNCRLQNDHWASLWEQKWRCDSSWLSCQCCPLLHPHLKHRLPHDLVCNYTLDYQIEIVLHGYKYKSCVCWCNIVRSAPVMTVWGDLLPLNDAQLELRGPKCSNKIFPTLLHRHGSMLSCCFCPFLILQSDCCSRNRDPSDQVRDF